jgi:hypothetical protein
MTPAKYRANKQQIYGDNQNIKKFPIGIYTELCHVFYTKTNFAPKTTTLIHAVGLEPSLSILQQGHLTCTAKVLKATEELSQRNLIIGLMVADMITGPVWHVVASWTCIHTTAMEVFRCCSCVVVAVVDFTTPSIETIARLAVSHG